MKGLLRRASNVFFDRKKEWSQRKHESLSGYVPQFARILGQHYGPVFVVDGFAGQGYYDDGTVREDGSPLVIAKIAQELNGYDLRCINVEYLGPEFDSLSEATASFPKVDNRHGAFADHVDGILRDIAGAPTFFFLDPFGLKGLDWNALSKVGNRPWHLKTELMINFMAPRFDLDAGWLFSTDEKTAQSFINKLDRVMGPLDWRPIWQGQELSREHRYELIADLYRSGLEENFGFMASMFPISALDGGLKYYLIHATRHPLGRRIMGSVFYGIHQRYLKKRSELQAQSGIQGALPIIGDHRRVPTLEEMEEEDLQQLIADIRAILTKRGAVTFTEIQDLLDARWFGRMVTKHYREACTRLKGEGVVTWVDSSIKVHTAIRPTPALQQVRSR